MRALLCTVRGCRRILEGAETRLLCPEKHSFDIARSGYINLLQPQDRRSKRPGDTAAAVAARRRLHDLGITRPLFEAVKDMIRASPDDAIFDAGCGEGFYSGSLAAETGCRIHGVDISIPAIDAAARRYPGCEWVVANADRFVPYADGAFSAVMSVTARMNSPEFRRVLKAGGRLLIALPAPDDLIELRGIGRHDRADRTIKTFSGEFTFEEKHQVRTLADLDETAVRDLLISIYRPLGSRHAEAMCVTFSLDLLLFTAREIPEPGE